MDEAVDGQCIRRARAGGAPHRDRRRRGPTDATCGGTTTVDIASAEHTPEAFDSEHPLFLLYTSGTTGKPKGIMHTTGGYLTQASYTHSVVFDVKPETDVYWCTADIGWVTGHTYIVYGPLSNGVTQVVYEGTPNSPNEHRHFEVIEKYGVTIYYTAPTLIRTFMKWAARSPTRHDLSSLRLLGSVGEPINPEAWRWYRMRSAPNETPIVDTWWQTETGAIMISPLPGVTDGQARLGDDAAAGHLGQDRRRGRQRAGAGRRRGRARHGLPGARPAVAVDAARHLGRPGAVQGDLLVAVRQAGLVLRRRRRTRSTPTATSGCWAASTT